MYICTLHLQMVFKNILMHIQLSECWTKTQNWPQWWRNIPVLKMKLRFWISCGEGEIVEKRKRERSWSGNDFNQAVEKPNRSPMMRNNTKERELIAANLWWRTTWRDIEFQEFQERVDRGERGTEKKLLKWLKK